VSVVSDPEEHEVERDAAQLVLVRVGGLLGRKLPANAMLDGRATLEAVEQPLADEPVVRALVVGTNAPLVREPELRPAPIRL